MQIDILFEDQDLVIINKPAGILTVADRYNMESLHLQSLLRKRYGEIFTVHRLDRDTSGVIVFAKNAETHKLLSALFESRDIEKYYLAFVQGQTPPDGEIETFLAESQHVQGKMVVSKKGKWSHTSFRTIENFKTASFLKVRIHTGRMHQIRVHMQHIGHALLVDPQYGGQEALYLSELKGRKYRPTKDEDGERPLVYRLTLHAYQLKFAHPITGEQLEIVADLPKDLRALLNQLQKWQRL